MINREKHIVTYRAFTNTKDDYGQLKQEWVDTNIEMMIKIQNQINVEDPRFVDVDSVGISRELLTAGNKIIDNDRVYLIKYVIPSSRYQQALLKCEK